MIRRPPRSTQSRSSAASDVYKRQLLVPRSLRRSRSVLPLRSTLDRIRTRIVSSRVPLLAPQASRPHRGTGSQGDPVGSHTRLLWKRVRRFQLDLSIDAQGPNDLWLSLIHISEPTRRTPISYAVFCL